MYTISSLSSKTINKDHLMTRSFWFAWQKSMLSFVCVQKEGVFILFYVMIKSHWLHPYWPIVGMDYSIRIQEHLHAHKKHFFDTYHFSHTLVLFLVYSKVHTNLNVPFRRKDDGVKIVKTLFCLKKCLSESDFFLT